DTISQVNVEYLPDKYKKALKTSQLQVLETFDLVVAVNKSDQDLNEFIPGYEELHHLVRRIELEVRKIEFDIHELEQRKMRLERNGNSVDALIMKQIGESIETFQGMKDELEEKIPSQWQSEREKFEKLNKEARESRQKYRRNSDSAYEPLIQLSAVLNSTQALLEMEKPLNSIKSIIENEQPDSAMQRIKKIESALGGIKGVSSIKSKISKARRALKGKKPNPEKALQQWQLGMSVYYQEIEWRQLAVNELAQPLANYELLLKDSIGLRMQKKLNKDQALAVAACKSSHEDISLFF
ncbi:MAG TPA: C4-dicarboxylate ABC transporter permease, partial [Candidatus Lambdaproteobacteria bacterium]|nr:C4-dicarboxylate ABC transporter permease [Candidatus Lambdaproteobacteria bacterium]